MLKLCEGGPEIEAEEPPVIECRHVTGKVPESVSIVAMGPSQRIWHNGNGSYDRAIPQTEETWGLNKGLRTLRVDVGFVLDDLVGESRKSDQYTQDIRNLRIPIITTIIDHDVRQLFPHNLLIPFPAESIIWEHGVRYGIHAGFTAEQIMESGADIHRIGMEVAGYATNSVPMMLAYAQWIGVKRVYIYGADYTYPGQEAREDDRACAEYWVGICRGQGMEVQVCADSTLLSTRSSPRLYGYNVRQPVVRVPTREDLARILRHMGVTD